MSGKAGQAPKRPHAGPDVVWLTADDVADASANGLDGANDEQKVRVRFTVEVRAFRWADWAQSFGVRPDSEWWFALTRGRRWHRWYVVPSPILASSWLDVIDTVTGEPLYEGLEQRVKGTLP